MSINFNTYPYYDDFDDSKNFHRILFKPGFAVQARELTQSQTILQSQISKFADNIFSQNTPVTGGKVTTNLRSHYIKLQLQYNSVNITASDFLNKIVTDSTGSILARVIATVEATGTATNPGDPPTLIVSYISGVMFSDAQTIYPTDGTNIAATTIGVTGGTTCTGLSSTVSISQGVFYVVNGWSLSSVENSNGTYSKYTMGHFVSVQPQTIVLDKYSNTPSYRVGLQITETVVDYIDDSSLLDPAVGAANFQAPGADRYKIYLTLTTLPLTLGNDDQFIELLRLKNGSVLKQVDGTVYSVINDYIAKRDYETNGDYIVNDFKLTTSKNAANNANLYDLTIGKGIAYVHGYRLENQSDLTLSSNRARTTQSVINNDVYIDYGSYFYIDTVRAYNGTFFDTTGLGRIDFHCANANVSSITTGNAYISTLVGTGYIRDLQYVSNGSTDSNTYVYKAYVNDITYNTLTATVTTSGTSNLTFVDTTSKFSTAANAYYNMPIKVGSDIRNIVSYSVNGTSKEFTVDQPFTVNPTGGTPFTISMYSTDIESLVYNTGTTSSPTVSSFANINATSGKVNGISTGDTVLYNAGAPALLFNVGNPKVASLSNSSYVSKMEWRNQSASSGSLILNLSSPFNFVGSYSTPLLSQATINQNYIVINNTTGKVIDFSAGAGNTIGLTNNGLTATLTLSGNPSSVTVITTVDVDNASTTATLKPKNLITGNTSIVSSSLTTISGLSQKIDLTKGQIYIPKASVSSDSMSLYVSDLKQVTKIFDTGSASAPTSGTLTSTYTDITSRFVVNNGQKDNFYDHAYIKLLPGANLPTGGLVVVFDWYTHTGVGSVTATSTGTNADGYFSVLSYLGSSNGGISASPDTYQNITTYTSGAGTIYSLTDCLDFRPVRLSGQTTFGLEYSSPSSARHGFLIPTDLSQYTSNYSYYLARKDLLVLSKDKSFQIISGTPAINPVYPVQPDGSLLLANIDLDPYTAYVPGENPSGTIASLSITKVPHNRWAKSDISDLQQRVNNLEYYTSLSMLEQNAQSLQISDVNGLNRFKNGILVDDFSSFATADTSNQDFLASIDVRNNILTALTEVDNFQLHNLETNKSLGTLTKLNGIHIHSVHGTGSNFYTLDYTTANVITQPIASSAVSVNPFSVFTQQGLAQLIPPIDNWVDNNPSPAILITDPSMQIYQQDAGSNITNTGDWATIPGTSTTKKTTVNKPNHTNANWGFGVGVGTSTTTTKTYASQSQNITTTGGYKKLPNGMQTVGDFITNVSVLPYIRSQQVMFNVKGLSVNTPVYAFFDGVDVSDYISTLDVVELINVSGTFKNNDIVGFYQNSQFYPVARVGSVYVYPGTTNVRLYVSMIPGMPSYSETTTMIAGTFDANGNYIDNHTSPSAQGTINTGIEPISSSGIISGVGGHYAIDKTSSVSIPLYKVKHPITWNTFLNLYGVWKDNKQKAGTYQATFNVPFPAEDTYTFAVSVYYGGTTTANVAFNGTDVSFNGSTAITKISSKNDSPLQGTVTVSTPGVYPVSWRVVSSTGSTAGIALMVVNSAGDVIFQSSNPPNLTYAGTNAEILMNGGGSFFTGVTQIKLDPKSSSGSIDDYLGTIIKITSTYVYDHEVDTATVTPPPPPPAPSTPKPAPGKAQQGHYTKVHSVNPPINKSRARGAANPAIKTVTKAPKAKNIVNKVILKK